MAHTSIPSFTHIAAHGFAQTAHTLRDGATRALEAVIRFLQASHSGYARLAQVERLNAKSDAELAEMGLTRDRIPAYVFRDVYYI